MVIENETSKHRLFASTKLLSVASAFVLLSIWELWIIWSNKYLPMIDLPGHMAQVAVWLRLGEVDYPFSERFQTMWFQPYLLAYALTRLFAEVLPLVYAQKVVITLSTVGLPLSMAYLLKRLGRDPVWALFGFAISLNYSFYFGFISYSLSLPLGIIVLGLWIEYLKFPSTTYSLALILTTLLLSLSHALAFALFLGLAGVYTLAETRRLSDIGRLIVVSAGGLFFIAMWQIIVQSGASAGRSAIEWQLGWQRILELPTYLLSATPSERLATFAGFGLFVLPFLFGARLSRKKGVWAMWLAAVVLFFLSPVYLLKAHYIYCRFAVPVFILSLLVLDISLAGAKRRLATALVTATVAAWFLMISFRFSGFNSEACQVDGIIEDMQPERRAVVLLFETHSLWLTSFSYGHFGSTYTIEKDGLADYSFFSYNEMPIHYRREWVPQSAGFRFHLNPRQFDYPNFADYDYFMIRSAYDLGSKLFREHLGRVRLIKRSGQWWLYENLPISKSG